MPATLDPLNWATLEDFKEHLDIDASDTSKDNFLTNILNAAWKAAVNYIGQDLNATDYIEYYDGDGSDSFLVDQFPIISIASIYDDISGDFPSTSLVPADDYVFYANTGKVRKRQNSEQLTSSWGIPQSIVWQRGVQNIKITYRAGYEDIPYDAHRAVCLLGGFYAQAPGTEGKTAETLGGKTVTYSHLSIPLSVRQLLVPYKKFSS